MQNLEIIASQLMKVFRCFEVQSIISRQWQKIQKLIPFNSNQQISKKSQEKNVLSQRFSKLSIENNIKMAQIEKEKPQNQQEESNEQLQEQRYYQSSQKKDEKYLTKDQIDYKFLENAQNLQGKDKDQLEIILKRLLQLNSADLLFYYKTNKGNLKKGFSHTTKVSQSNKIQ